MELLSEIWDKTNDAFSAMSEGVSEGLIRLFGNSNERQIRRMRPIVARINELEPSMQSLTDDQLYAKTEEFRSRLAKGETLDALLPEAFAACRESGRRFLKMRHYDVQLMGAMVLHGGNIAEMVTGEGKTLVATLAAYLNALTGKGVHVVTVNDYLARRDAEWMSPLFSGLGMTVGAIQSEMDSEERREVYSRDVTYGTNNEFGFDYLRDNMKPTKDLQAQGPLNYAIIDEVDSILIDEARTPLIISGPAFDDVRKYAEADRIARLLRRDVHFEVKEKERTCHLNDEGIREAEKIAGIESFYTPGNMEWPHLIDNSLKAHHLYKRDRDYVEMNGEIVIVDEFTGRLMTGRQWSDGLHQAVEAKERVKIKEENQTLATITLQNFFKLYKKLSGMTGTAMTEANEFYKVYHLDVVAIPTNRTLTRQSYADVIYRSDREKFNSILKEIQEVHATGRPILVGTTSIEKSEEIADLLKRHGIPHQVLNAKYHEREAEIVAQAGRKGAVTIATNMAGRGTDIILGGNPEFMAWADLKRLTNEDGRPLYPTRLEVPPQVWVAAVEKYAPEMKAEGREVAEAGGLHIIGTERHESRRIDNQLRGRAGRQGDPGTSRFFLSLEDDLMRKFAGEWVSNVLTRLGMEENEAIESKLVSRRIEGAQKKVEERNFDSRKNLLEYDEVMDEQRKRIYSFRQRLLDGYPAKDSILDMIDEQVKGAADRFLADDYGTASFAEWAGQRLGVELAARDFRGSEFQDAEEEAKRQAERQANDQVREAIEENLPPDADPSEWTWQSLASWANTRYSLNLKDKDLRKFGSYEGGEFELDRNGLEDFLVQKANHTITTVDLAPSQEFLKGDWGRRSLAGWVHHKFGLAIDPAEWEQLSKAEIVRKIQTQTRELYARKEAEFPVQVGLTKFLAERSQNQSPRYDRDGLALWASERFRTAVDPEELRPLLRPEIEALLLEVARKHYRGAKLAEELERRIDAAYGPRPEETRFGPAPSPAPDAKKLAELVAWARAELGVDANVEEMTDEGREEARLELFNALDSQHRPEMREMEKVLVLQILDSSWMEHLRAMDHLRSSVGLQGYAQIDPKVEYKREGMRIFSEMWTGVSDKVTDLIFRVEQFDPEFLSYLGSRWQLDRAQTIHQAPASELSAASPASGIRAQQEAAIASSQQSTEKKAEPVRNLGKKVGRNDPCPCGSGKKFKACCMRKEAAADSF
ncbi:preprotein translocase subunit SecA [Singulisphaera sp. PoT]|uniref:preprotein translocase subunit SecA n=1 Tax=Singulisphaera sp. PoT TaxID=3411797 RepID=UPI003BF4A386